MYGSAFILSLPSEITIDILSRLPLPAILTCKCVCKRWHNLISSNDFAEHHLTTISNAPSSSSTHGLVLYNNYTEQSSCKIFELEDVPDLPNHNLHYKQLNEFDPRSFITDPNSVIWFVGSVNGLLCLRDANAQLDAYYICNPLTHEYVSLPCSKEAVQYPNIVAYGFGVSSLSGQYKLVRINHDSVLGPVRMTNTECIVYTLGSGSWRGIGSGGSYEYISYSLGAFLNGYLHWLVCDANGLQLITRFNLETEDFEPMSPPFPGGFSRSLVVLGDCLCYCDHGSDEEIVIWVMKEYGIEESWTKEIVIDKYATFDFITYEAVFPVKVFKDGDIVVLVENSGLYCYSTENKTASEVAMFHLHGDIRCEAILHCSSFLSLKRFLFENVGTF